MARSYIQNWFLRSHPMADNLTQKQRSACMRSVRSEDTAPEMLVRKAVHALGYRYAIHRKDLPGKPDIVFVSRRKIIFVHGCFWHMHKCQHGRNSPSSNIDYWLRKREANTQRDKRNARLLRATNWKVLVVWECWTRDMASLAQRLVNFLN
jgi:DNA mismatch endonuclease, patch repair protein